MIILLYVYINEYKQIKAIAKYIISKKHSDTVNCKLL